MKIAVVGSRKLDVLDLENYLPEGVTEIVSGGADGVDAWAKIYARLNSLKYTEFRPEYKKYGRAAPLKRNLQIIDYADEVVAIWDGKSKGTKHVIDQCKEQNKKITVYLEKPYKPEKEPWGHLVIRV